MDLNNPDKKPWYRQKTTWTAVSTLIGAAGGIATGTIQPVDAVQLAAPAIMAIFLRQGVEYSK